ncbi:hypothetical protein LXL04_003756 [Taraxacum kok-saghyz]
MLSVESSRPNWTKPSVLVSVGVGHSGKDNFDRLASFHISGQIRKYLQQREGGLSSYAASTLVKVKADSSCVRIVHRNSRKETQLMKLRVVDLSDIAATTALAPFRRLPPLQRLPRPRRQPFLSPRSAVSGGVTAFLLFPSRSNRPELMSSSPSSRQNGPSVVPRFLASSRRVSVSGSFRSSLLSSGDQHLVSGRYPSLGSSFLTYPKIYSRGVAGVEAKVIRVYPGFTGRKSGAEQTRILPGFTNSLDACGQYASCGSGENSDAQVEQYSSIE